MGWHLDDVIACDVWHAATSRARCHTVAWTQCVGQRTHALHGAAFGHYWQHQSTKYSWVPLCNVMVPYGWPQSRHLLSTYWTFTCGEGDHINGHPALRPLHGPSAQMTYRTTTLDNLEGYWQPVRSAILATGGLLVLQLQLKV